CAANHEANGAADHATDDQADCAANCAADRTPDPGWWHRSPERWGRRDCSPKWWDQSPSLNPGPEISRLLGWCVPLQRPASFIAATASLGTGEPADRTERRARGLQGVIGYERPCIDRLRSPSHQLAARRLGVR